nr:hypothetical protein [Tanacetum cinerariifolium]
GLASCIAVQAIVHSGLPNVNADAAGRAMQGILSGVGFIGAGAVLRVGQGQEVHGLATAACIWFGRGSLAHHTIADPVDRPCDPAHGPAGRAGHARGLVDLHGPRQHRKFRRLRSVVEEQCRRAVGRRDQSPPAIAIAGRAEVRDRDALTQSSGGPSDQHGALVGADLR